MAERVRFPISMTVRSPFLFQGLANAIYGIDAAQIRDEGGRPIIPADQIRGILRAALETLAARAPGVIGRKQIDHLFGIPSRPHDEVKDGATFDVPERGRLFFTDLTAEKLDVSDTVRTAIRVEIDDETGAAKTGALLATELAAPFGQDVAFEGHVILHVGSGLNATAIGKALDLAIRLVPAIGACKSAGFGEVVSAAVAAGEQIDAGQPSASAKNNGSDLLRYRVKFDRPVLVDAVRDAENLFVGNDILPGAAFKGALATMLALHGLEDDTNWSSALSALRFSHAFPACDDDQPANLPIPFSVIAWKAGPGYEFGDLLLRGEASALSPSGQSGIHVIDWKNTCFEAFSAATGWPASISPSPVARTHVSINPENLVANDGILFTTVAKSANCRWILDVDLAGVPEDTRAALVSIIERGLEPVGRTQANASFTRIATVMPKAAPIAPGGSDYALTLVTPALLLDPRNDASSGRQYAAYFKETTGGELERFFATRALAGGYLSTRYRRYGAAYYPFVLTSRGSVFLIRNADPDRMTRIARLGLPPAQMRDAAPATWRNCPYLPENGYGQVRFNLVDHVALGGGAGHV